MKRLICLKQTFKISLIIIYFFKSNLFFFFIGNKSFIASKKAMSQVYRKYTELTAKHYSMQESKNSKIEEKEDEPIFYSIQLGPFEALCEIVILFLLIFFVP